MFTCVTRVALLCALSLQDFDEMSIAKTAISDVMDLLVEVPDEGVEEAVNVGKYSEVDPENLEEIASSGQHANSGLQSQRPLVKKLMNVHTNQLLIKYRVQQWHKVVLPCGAGKFRLCQFENFVHAADQVPSVRCTGWTT